MNSLHTMVVGLGIMAAIVIIAWCVYQDGMWVVSYQHQGVHRMVRIK